MDDNGGGGGGGGGGGAAIFLDDNADDDDDDDDDEKSPRFLHSLLSLLCLSLSLQLLLLLCLLSFLPTDFGSDTRRRFLKRDEDDGRTVSTSFAVCC